MANGHGGARKGAGGPRGKPHGATKLATSEERKAFAEKCRSKTDDMIKQAVTIMTESESDAARMSAIAWLADRGYGKAVQAVELTDADGEPSGAVESFTKLLNAVNAAIAKKAETV